MKKLIVLLACMIGCSAAQWADFKTNPAAYIAVYEQTVTTFLSEAEVIFNALLPLLGYNAPAAQSRYNAAVAGVNHALAALNAALKADQDANADPTNLIALQSNVTTSVGDLEQALSDFRMMVGSNANLGAAASSAGPWNDMLNLERTIFSYPYRK